MALHPDIAEQERIAHAATERDQAIDGRERRGEAMIGGAFVAASAILLATSGLSGLHIAVVPALGCVVALAVAANVPFAVGDGYTVPTQLAFVPLLFTVSPALVPVAVLVALALARLPAVARRRPLSRLLLLPGDAWFAVGPAVVLTLFGTGALHRLDPGVVVAVFLAQALVEIAAWALRGDLRGGPGLRGQLPELWIHVVDASFVPIGLVIGSALAELPWAPLALLPLFGVLAIFAQERQARLNGLIELNQAYHGTALVLGDVVEVDDSYTGEHSRGVVAMAMAVGDALGLEARQRRNLEFGALLHDVGKIAIPKDIINKPGKLNPAEWTIIKTHTTEGQRMLDRVGGFMAQVGMIVRSHHERWDGTGYPDGLAGAAIPLEARIVSCCDTWNAMTTDRTYRPALAVAEAVAEMRASAGTQFDPRVVEALLTLVDAAPASVVRTLRAA